MNPRNRPQPTAVVAVGVSLVLHASVILVALSSDVLAQSIRVPENAMAMGDRWVCRNGFRREGDRCVKVDVPENAMAMGDRWVCRLGFKQSGDTCIEMSAEEKAMQLQLLSQLAAKSSNEPIRYDDYEFSLRDVERKCEVYRYSENYGDVECSGSDLKPVERYCEAYFSGGRASTGEIECSRSELRPIERRCTVDMYSRNYGDISC